MKRLSILLVALGIGIWIGSKEIAWVEEIISSKHIQELINQLGDDDWAKRESVTEELIRIGEPAIEQIKQILSHPDPEVRLRAALIFKTIKWGVTPELRQKIDNLMDNYDKATNEAKQLILNQLSQHGLLAAPVYLRLIVYEPDETLKERVYQLLQMHLNNANFVQKLRSFLTKPPDHPAGSSVYWINRLLGDSYYRVMNYIETIQYYEKAYIAKPNDQTVIAMLDSLYLQTKQWDKGIVLYENLVKGESGRADYCLKLGIIYYRKGDKDKARNIWNEMMKLSNIKENEFYQLGNFNEFYQLGSFYETQNELAEAIKVYEQGIIHFPEDSSLIYRLAMCHKEQTNYDKAITLLEEALRKVPHQPNSFLDLLKQLGECYFYKNDLPRAKETWWKMINTEEINPIYFHRLIQVLEGNNLADEVIKAYQAARKAFPETTAFRIGLAKSYYQNMDIKLAFETLLEAYQANASDFEAIAETFRIISLSDESNTKMAISLIQEHLKVKPNQGNIKLQILLARAFEMQNDNDKEIFTIKELLKDIDNFDEFDYRETGHLFCNASAYDEAILLYTKMLKFYQQKGLNCAEVYEDWGNCYYAKGAIDKAKETWFKITSGTSNKDPTAYFNQGRIFLTHQMFIEARQTCENALKITDDPNILISFYQLLIKIVPPKRDPDVFGTSEERNIKQALDYYIQATKLISNNTNYSRLNDYLIDLSLKNPLPDKPLKELLNELDTPQKSSVLIMLTLLYQSQGKLKEAIESLKTASQLAPNNKDLQYQLALIYEQSNQIDSAEEIYRNFIKEEPNNALPLYLLAKIYQKKDVDKSETMLSRATEISKQATEDQNLQWGNYLKQIGLNDFARAELEHVIKKSPKDSINDANAYEALTNLMVNNDQHEKALNYIEQERKIIVDEGISLMFDLDTVFSKEYQPLTHFQKMDYINSYIKYCQGMSYYQKNETEKGQARLKRAIEIYPGNLAALEEIADLFRAGKFPEADFKKLSHLVTGYRRQKLEDTPSSSYCYYALAETYRILEYKTDKALELAKNALQLEPAVLDYYTTLTKLYIREKDFSSARLIVQALINLKPYQKSFQELREKIGDK